MISNDPYSRLQYRRLIAWPKRIEREAPLLQEVLGSGSSRLVLDLGCGTGEHARFLASAGYEVVGVDRAEGLLEEARREAPAGVSFFRADLGTLADHVSDEIDGVLRVSLAPAADLNRLDVVTVLRWPPASEPAAGTPR